MSNVAPTSKTVASASSAPARTRRNRARVPPLDKATPVQVAQAVRVGPYVMPRFSERDISNPELDSIIAYVEYTKNPDDRGGWGIGHLGPFPEGMVTWLIAAVALVATCVGLGRR